MSYIHKALNKAQRDKDKQFQQYEGVLAGPAERKVHRFPVAGRRRLLIFGVVCLLAFVSYSWFDSGKRHSPETGGTKHKPNTQAAEVKPGVPVPAKKSILKNKAAKDAKVLYKRARAFHRTGRLDNARRLYQEALKVDPAYAEALNNLGVIYIHDKNYEAARNSLEKAARVNPGWADPYYNLACLYALMGKIKPGILQIKKACSINPEVKKWAREDADLNNLRGNPEFEALIKE